MLDVAVPDEAYVSKTAAVTGAHVSADPVVVELVVVGAGAQLTRRLLQLAYQRTVRRRWKCST